MSKENFKLKKVEEPKDAIFELIISGVTFKFSESELIELKQTIIETLSPQISIQGLRYPYPTTYAAKSNDTDQGLSSFY